jgi:hypothetical protein
MWTGEAWPDNCLSEWCGESIIPRGSFWLWSTPTGWEREFLWLWWAG